MKTILHESSSSSLTPIPTGKVNKKTELWPGRVLSRSNHLPFRHQFAFLFTRSCNEVGQASDSKLM